MQKKQVIILIIILLIAVIGGGVWYVNKKQGAVNKEQSKIVNQQEIKKQDTEEQQVVKKSEEQKKESQQEQISSTDKNEIIDAFMQYLKNNDKRAFNMYENNEKHISAYIIRNINNRSYFKGIVWVDGQHSTPYILAVKNKNAWKVVFNGQDHPPCDIVDEYKIPKEICDVCFDAKNQKLRCEAGSINCY